SSRHRSVTRVAASSAVPSAAMRLPALFVALSLIACTDPMAAPDAGSPIDAGRDAHIDRDVGPYMRQPESVVGPGRSTCAYARGAHPWETIGSEYPIGQDIPIRHFIILMQENRSFDHYFGSMSGVDGIPAGASNPHADGTPVPAFHTD